MLSPTRGLLRGVRAASLGIVGFVLALVGHKAAGGDTPGPVALLLLAGLIGLAAVLLTVVRLSPVRFILSLATMQVALHEAFMWLGSPTACAITQMSAPAGRNMAHNGQPTLACATGMAQTGMSQNSVFTGIAMVGAHVVATAVMAALLAYGETVLWILAGLGACPPVDAHRPPEGAGGAAGAFRVATDVAGAVRLQRGGPSQPPPRLLFASA
jgi:hypothetical protein